MTGGGLERASDQGLVSDPCSDVDSPNVLASALSGRLGRRNSGVGGARENHSAAATPTAYAMTTVTTAPAVPGFSVVFQTIPRTRAMFVYSGIQRPGCRVI